MGEGKSSACHSPYVVVGKAQRAHQRYQVSLKDSSIEKHFIVNKAPP